MDSKRKQRTKTTITRILLACIASFHCLSFIFGLTTFYYDAARKSFSRSRTLWRYNRFMTATFFILYLINMFIVFKDKTAVTMNSQNLATIVTVTVIQASHWLFTTVFLRSGANESVTYIKVKNALLRMLFDEDLLFEFAARQLHCVLRTTLLLVAFSIINFVKSKGSFFKAVFGLEMRILGSFCTMYPSYVIILNSNRRLVTTNLCWFLVMKHNDRITLERLRRHANSVDVDELHRTSILFEHIVAMQRANWQYVMINIGFSAVNLIIEVTHIWCFHKYIFTRCVLVISRYF